MRSIKLRLLGPLAAFFVALGAPVFAQDNPFNPAGTGSVSLSASNVSSNVALPSNTPTALVCNAGAVNVFVRFGASSAITATTSNFILLPGLCQTFNVASQTYMAGITSSGSATVWLTQGRGNAAASPSGAAGGPVTLPTSPSVAAGSGVVVTPASTSTAAFTITNASSAALEATRAAKASGGNVYGAYATAIAGGAAGFLVGYNATTCPGDGAVTAALVLDVCVIDTTNKGCSISRPGPPRNYSAGICFYITTGASPFANKATGTDTGYISVDYN